MQHHYTLDQMDWPRLLAVSGIEVRGVIHVGAHEGQEVPVYRALGFDPILLVEADPDLARDLFDEYSESPDVIVIPIAAGKESGRVNLYRVLRDSQYNSTLAPIKLGQVETVQVPMLPLRDVALDGVNVMVIDVQGSELDVVDGAYLEPIDLIVLEVGSVAKYDGQPHRDVVEAHMQALGWRKIYEWPHGVEPKVIWWDIAYVKE